MFRRRPPEPSSPPEWLIVGLGNPGPEYKNTRHNVGFDVIDKVAAKNRIKLDKGRNRALVGRGRIGDHEVMLVKPLTWMNNSGQAVGPLSRSAGVKPDHILVITDDLDLKLGQVKLKLKGSAGGHNGHKSIIAAIGQDYPRIKIGIDKVSKFETIDHVLSKFDPDEREIIDSAIDVAVEASELAVKQGINAALNRIAAYKHPPQTE